MDGWMDGWMNGWMDANARNAWQAILQRFWDFSQIRYCMGDGKKCLNKSCPSPGLGPTNENTLKNSLNSFQILDC
jgi:hypothetical protein